MSTVFIIFGVILFIVALICVFTYLAVRVWVNNKPVFPPEYMKINIEITNLSNNIFELPLTFTGNESVFVNWGDGSAIQLLQSDVSHTYENLGNYTIEIVGKATRYGKDGYYNGANTIKSVTNWGNLELKSLAGAFRNATNLTSVPNYIPSTVTILNNMFNQASNFNGDISGWDTSNVTSMTGMFFNAINFNQNINSWDTSKVTDMSSMFESMYFNQPIGTWNTGNVINMPGMFSDNISFNQDLSSWNVEKVTNASFIFTNCPMLSFTSKYPGFVNGLPAPGNSYYG